MVALHPEYSAELAAWRQNKHDELMTDESWLTLAGLHWLHDGINTLGADSDCDVPLPAGSAYMGTLTLNDEGVTLTVTSSDVVLVDGEPIRTVLLRSDKDTSKPSRVRIDAVTFIIIVRSGQYAVRVWDHNQPARAAFKGRNWYDPDPSYRVQAQFVPHHPPRTVNVVNVVGLTDPYTNPGYVEFNLSGTQCRLEAFEARKGWLWFVFRDATSGNATYGVGRFLYAQVAQDGQVTLDFNQAYNPPCAFTPYATCPIPPQENVLSLPIEAGELKAAPLSY